MAASSETQTQFAPRVALVVFEAQAQMNEGWQWGVAASIAELLLKTDAKAYRQFVLGIKEGQTWQESLQDAYGLSPADLVQLYGQHIGVPNLRP